MLKVDIAKQISDKIGAGVFPIKPGAKSPPLLHNWPKTATRDYETMTRYWAPLPDANIGIHCEGLCVIDVDAAKGGDQSLDLLDLTYEIPETLTTRTPSGGRHLFFRLPEGHPGVQNSVEKLGKGLDIRSTNGYVVAPGSRVPLGEYIFEVDAPIVEAPGWLLDRLGTVVQRAPAQHAPVPDAPESAYSAAQRWIASHPGAVEGEGGDAHTYATACRLRDMGVSEHQCLELLVSWNTQCLPPWDEADLQVKVRNAYKYAQNEAGARVALPKDFEAVAPATAPSAPPRASQQAVRLLDFAGDTSRRKPYLIKGLLTCASHAVLYGAPGEGKTFVALDLAYHVAAGLPWMGRKVKQGPVLYLAFEGIGGLSARAQALIQHYGKDDVPLYLHDTRYNLREQSGRKALAAMIGATGIRPAFIVIDTLAQALMGADENSAQDMGAMNSAIAELIAASGACVMVVHHSGKNKAAGARGSSALLGAIDTEIEIDEYEIEATKQRDIALGEPIGFRLQPIPVGTDEDGDVIMSCVVAPAEIKSNAREALKGNAKRGFEVLCEMSPNNNPVNVHEWREACEADFLSDTRNKAQRFSDLARTLRAKGFIEVTNLHVQRKME